MILKAISNERNRFVSTTLANARSSDRRWQNQNTMKNETNTIYFFSFYDRNSCTILWFFKLQAFRSNRIRFFFWNQQNCRRERILPNTECALNCNPKWIAIKQLNHFPGRTKLFRCCSLMTCSRLNAIEWKTRKRSVEVTCGVYVSITTTLNWLHNFHRIYTTCLCVCVRCIITWLIR